MDVDNASQYVLSATLIPSGLYGTGLQRFRMERVANPRQDEDAETMRDGGIPILPFLTNDDDDVCRPTTAATPAYCTQSFRDP
jgi:hypothetical protein